MTLKPIIASVLSISLVANSLSWAFYVSLINMALTPKVFAADEIFDQMGKTYDLNDPAANRNATTSAKDIIEKYASADSGTNLSPTISDKYIGKAASQDLDVGKYGSPNSNSTVTSNVASDGRSIGGKVSLPGMSGTSVSMNYSKEGAKKLSKEADGSISVSNNPVQTAGTKASTEEIFSSEQHHPDTQFSAGGSYGNQDAFTNEIKGRKSQLFNANSYDGVGYRMLVNATKDNPAPTISPNDPLFNAGRNEISNAVAGTGNWLQNCSTENTSKTVTTHYPDYKESYCNTPKKDNFSSCTITRDFSVPVYISGGNGDMTTCGDNCVRVYFGQRGDDYFSNGVFDNSLTLQFHKNAVLKQARVVNGEWDDHMRVTLDGNQIFAHIDGKYRDNDYPAPLGTMDLKKSWKLDAPIDITEKVRKSVYDEPDREVTMASRVWVGGKGEGYFEVELTFEDSSLSDKHIQEPAGCYDAVKIPNSFCRFDRFNDLYVGTKRLPASLLNLASPLYDGDKGFLTWKTNLEGYFCDPLAQQKMCSYDADGNIMKDAQGNELCYNYEQIKNMPDACSQYRNDSACTQDSQTCAEGWYEDGTKTCYMYEQKWTCDRGTDVTHVVKTETNSCVGMIPCSGGTCQTGPKEENTDFGKAAAYSSMVQYMQGEATCSDPNDGNTCVVFDGKPEWCGRSVGFVNGLAKTDCCESPQGAAGPLDAIVLAGSMMRNTNWQYISSKLSAWTGGETGTWSTMANSVGEWTAGASKTVGQMWGNITQPITSAYESVAGNLSRWVGSTSIEGGSAAAGGELTKDTMSTFGVAAIKQQMMNKAYDMMPGAIRDFVFDKTASAAAGQAVFSGAVTNFMLALNVIGWIYTAYQITKMLLEMLVACKPAEMEASIHKNQKSCFTIDTERCVKYLNVGFAKKCVKKATDMCCYNSMLSRVIMQQAYPQLGIDPVAANCAGLSIGQIQVLDFDKIDMSEWINSAVQAGESPDVYADYSEEYVSKQLPFKNESYVNTTPRTIEAMGGDKNMINARTEETQAITEANVDCSYLPRPAICDVGSTSVDPITGAKLDKYK